jgi:glycosyltransferase involved in cell wall biosynthesis
MTAFMERPLASAAARRESRPGSIAAQFGLGPPLPSVAVLIPCRNEEAAIGKVVTDFLRALPDATIFVYDNNSTDRTAAEARAAGAVVRREHLQGKGHVVRRMFADIEADVYILVDGDDTYDAAAAPGMLRMLLERQLDMVTATRHGAARDAYRRFHRMGNRMLSFLVSQAFGGGISDLLSGYRVFSRRFVKSFPALSSGFETETEFSVHALALHMPVQEVQTLYRLRAAGTRSKLKTFADGLSIFRALSTLVRQERPLEVFALAGMFLAGLGISLGIPVIAGFLHTGLVPRMPTAMLSIGLVMLGFLSTICGLVLDAVSRGRREIKRLAYLAIPPVEWLE